MFILSYLMLFPKVGTLGTGLYHTKDSPEKVSAQSVKN